MPVFDFKGPDGKQYTINGPDGATPEQAFSMLQKHLGSPQVSTGEDIAKAAGSGAVSGLGGLGNMRDLAVAGASKIAKGLTGEEMSPEARGNLTTAMKFLPMLGAPNSSDMRSSVGTLATGKPVPDYEPQTRSGDYAKTIAETLTNPLSYAGAGSLPFKIGSAVLGGSGAETGKQLTKGTGYELLGQIVGGALGGYTGAKALGPSVERAAVPTAQELKAAAVGGGQHGGYNAALNSGLELHPQAMAGWSQKVQQGLYNEGLTGGQFGTAPKTWNALEALQNAPAGSSITAQNVDAVRKTLGKISRETQPAQGGAMVATPDAAAASRSLRELGSYVENIPASHVVAGDAAAYTNATKEANANYAAYARTRDLDARVAKANTTAEGQIAGSVENQLKAKARQIINGNAGRGYTPEEMAQAQLVNSGGPVSNTLRHLGRGGAGVIPMMAHATGAVMTGGASVLPSLAIGLPLYAARKGSEAITKSRMDALAEMLAQRSPLYEQRAAGVQPPDLAPGRAAVLRAMIPQ